jgi:hypothetical protein
VKGEDQLISAVMRLRGAAPDAWDDFVKVMRMLSAIKAAELVKAPPDAIHQMQGQARAFDEMVGMFMEAPQKAHRAEELRRARAATS